ncbi:MAG: hypothetical protein M0T74_03535 [Desulfitobacterium hafniense]|nr:hypothetical protein [Desulfitobacterium hafniense]
MRQVRRKTAEPASRQYLLKAKTEGISLSWNNYESMLPQDGFSLLGLTCEKCLQGPCRLNPFRSENSTICGLDRDELVYSSLQKYVAKNECNEVVVQLVNEIKDRASSWSLNFNALKSMASRYEVEGENPVLLADGLLAKFFSLSTQPVRGKGVDSLLALAQKQQTLKAFANELAEVLYPATGSTAREVGLGVLNPKAVNLCFEGASPVLLAQAQQLAEELKEEALSRGAVDGFNITLIGDISARFPLSSVTNEGSAEFAILTGLVDLYYIGQDAIGRGRNVAKSYQTVIVDSALVIDKLDLRDVFLRAAIAYTQRDTGKVLIAEEKELIEISCNLDVPIIKAQLEQGVFKRVCLVGGGSNVKVTGDEVALKLAQAASANGVLCLTYGNAAISIGKYWALKGDSSFLNIGSEFEASKIAELAQKLGPERVVAVFPELSKAADIQLALCLAAGGSKVFTGIKLPVDGSFSLAHDFEEILTYCEPKELATKVTAALVC